MDKITLEKKTSTFLNDIITLFESFMNDATDGKRAAMAELDAAANAYTSDLSARSHALQEKLDTCRENLALCTRAKEAAVVELSAALSNDDSVSEEEAKKVIDEAAQREFVAERRYSALSEVHLTGKDEFYLATLDAWAKLRQQRGAESEVSQDAVNTLDVVINALEELRNRAAKMGDSGISESNIEIRKTWPVIERHIGHVDFSRSSVGGELNCQRRFIDALSSMRFDAGFVDSPAGDTLRKEMRHLNELRGATE